ncbi:plasminogen activator inhibitor 1-like [Bacillus rossius redtenbacheri]|uniref:plasminogen activator inhibitor 1-like n=1 Tax=Bacillus rossius redtenbacheri TaxID=93214 RepID=UPI002FDCE34E
MRAGAAVAVLVAALGASVLAGGRLHEAVDEFSVDLLKDVFAEPRNLVVSPVSVSTLLAMLDQGAQGDSAKQIEAAIHLNRRKARVLYGRLSHRLKEAPRHPGTQLEAANHVFVSRALAVRPRYLRLLRATYLSGARRVEFGRGEGGSAVNAWVRNATRGRVDAVVDPVLSSETAMVLVNAMFFQSPWLKPFKTSSTSEEAFHLLDGYSVSAPFMNKREFFNVGELPHLNASWFELLFLGGQYSLVVVVPRERIGLPQLVRNISAADLAGVISGGRREELQVALPRFALSSRTDLIPPLQRLGIKDIFDDDLSNLSGISKKKLVVSKAVQRVEMQIDEAGGLAAAATGFELEPRSYVRRLAADRPFLAAVVDKAQRLPLFVCAVVDPSRT